jgi:hypothetical protein
MMLVQSRGGSQALGPCVGELVEEGEADVPDLEVEDGILGHVCWAHRARCLRGPVPTPSPRQGDKGDGFRS